MRILHLTSHLDVGGITNYIVLLARALQQRGHICIVASAGGVGEPELERYGIRHLAIPLRTKSELSPKILRSIIAVRRIVREEKVELIHAHTRVAQVVAYFVWRLSGVPFVSTFHGFYQPRFFRRVFDAGGAKIIAISDAVRQSLIQELGIAPERIALVYNGIDLEEYSRTFTREEKDLLRHAMGIAAGPVIGTIGRLSPVKGQRYLVEAMRRVAHEAPGAQLVIVGEGPERAALESLVAAQGLAGAVHFVPSTSEMAPLLSIMDIFAFPSLSEGLGLALLEALAMRLPCVASRVGGIAEIIEDGTRGILVAPHNADALAGALLKLIHDETLSRRLADAGCAFVRKNFSLPLMAENISKVYEEVVRAA